MLVLIVFSSILPFKIEFTMTHFDSLFNQTENSRLAIEINRFLMNPVISVNMKNQIQA